MFVHFGAFLAISLLLAIAPGPDTALATRNALVGGRQAALFTVLGVATGLLVWTIAASVGIAALIQASEPAFLALKVVGSLYLRDTIRAAPGTTAAALARPAAFVPESQKADDLLRQMQRERFHLAMVVDEYGGIAGLVTMEDLIEELVGEISDESDLGGEEVVDLGDGRYRVVARFNIEDLGELFGIELDDDDIDSAGGLLTKALGELPRLGASVVVEGLRLTVDRMERRRVMTVIAERDESLVAAEDAFPPVRRSRA